MPLSLKHYMLAWVLNQQCALLFKSKFPGRLHILRVEDVMSDPLRTLTDFCSRLGLKPAASLGRPTWNGKELEEVYPWGTIRSATTEANRATALEVSVKERDEIASYARQFLEDFDYKNFLSR